MAAIFVALHNFCIKFCCMGFDDHNDITAILLKVAFNTIAPTLTMYR
jgi:hypothetical protein